MPVAYHPDLAARARRLPHGVARPWSVPVARGLLALTGLFVRDGSAADDADGVRVFVYGADATASTPRPALLWIHGGGLLFGDARQDAGIVRRLIAASGVLVVSVQYRLPPGHPFPTPLDDCAAAWRWLTRHPAVDPTRLAVGGASAGGGLAAALCQRIRDEGGPQPAFQLLVYPMLDDRSSDRDDVDDDALRLWDRRSNALGWGRYLARADRRAPPPYAVPGRATDLARLPPAWIGVGSHDLFHDEDATYAERLRAAGVPVTFERVEGAYHGFDAVDGDAPVSRAFHATMGRALATALGCVTPRA
ncbi:MAG: alpha/beta hydrolase [Alphaproteobacteria bacterium]|nr:alpha/beta hydrolase [Alphaproteobacteria bacterium]